MDWLVALRIVLIKQIQLRTFNLIFPVFDVVQKLGFRIFFFSSVGPGQSLFEILFFLKNLHHIINNQDFVITFIRFIFHQFLQLGESVFAIV